MGFLDGKKFFVFGAGLSGRSVADLLAGDGRDVVVYDENPETLEAYGRSIDGSAHAEKISVVRPGGGRDPIEAAAVCDRVVLSPGISLDHELVVAAASRGVGIDGEIEAAFHYTNADIVGVTGTNGKSTTVGVIGTILESAGVRSAVAGNIGTPFSSVVRGREVHDVYVLELSSFQLDTITDFKVRVAVLLNVTPDHLDRYHGSFEAYAASKARVLNRADGATWFVYNDADASCRRIAGDFGGNKVPFKTGGRPDGTNAVYLEHKSIVRIWRGEVEKVLDSGEFAPAGVHNLENAMAAVGAASAMDVSLDDIRTGLRSYRPLPHRMELVRSVGGVAYINDSKATNVDASIKSIISVDGGVVLILGGKDKEGDFRALAGHLGRVRKVILIGEAKNVIRAALEGKCDMVDAWDMKDAVGTAARYAQPGDTVLLAPACASFDMFDNFEHRGEVFRACVNDL